MSARSRSAATAVTTCSPVAAGRGVVGARRRLGRAERLLQRLVRCLQLGEDVLLELRGLLLGDVAVGDELRRELLAHGRVLCDRGGEERLRVRRLVLLVVPVPAVADEVDDDVVAEARAVGEREPDRGERRLRVVGVDVDDRAVEALREVARVARRAAARGSVVKPTWLFVMRWRVPPVQ